MDLRIHTKSGNQYYVNITNFDQQDVMGKLTDSIMRGDMYAISGPNEIFTINCKEIECFEIITDIVDEAIGLLNKEE